MTTRTPRSKSPSSAPTPDIPFELPKVSAAEKRQAIELLDMLRAAYPDAHCELNYTSPHELLIATILSAQTTDVGVNKATPALFARYPTPADYAKATPAEIEPYVRTLGFFRNKAKSVHLAMKAVQEKHGGRVPQTMDELLSLQGVARKTANVVLGNAFGINVGVVVDTHVERLSKRFGLVAQDANVAQIEKRLMALFPRESWCDLSHMLIWHGRRACKARHVVCPSHPICEKFGICCELRISAKPRKSAPARASNEAAKRASPKRKPRD
jgi:endonuclease III